MYLGLCCEWVKLDFFIWIFFLDVEENLHMFLHAFILADVLVSVHATLGNGVLTLYMSIEKKNLQAQTTSSKTKSIADNIMCMFDTEVTLPGKSC